VPPFVLLVLKIVFVALLYYFVYRAIRVGIVGVTGRTPRRQDAARPSAARAPRQPRKGRTPGSVVVLGEDGRKRGSRPLTGTIQVGRAEACQIRLDDSYVSQFHARLFSKNGAWFVEDLGSTNGTYLNQRKVTSPMPVQVGDRVKIGKVQLELRR
jgi:hypothetical protein